jgi:hypothetical protein
MHIKSLQILRIHAIVQHIRLKDQIRNQFKKVIGELKAIFVTFLNLECQRKIEISNEEYLENAVHQHDKRSV